MPLPDLTTFATLTQVKAFIPITTVNDDVILKQLLDFTTHMIQDYVGYNVIQGTYTEYLSTDGKSGEIFVNQPPIISITHLYDDPDRVYGSDTELVENTDFVIIDRGDTKNAGIIKLVDGGLFTKGVNNIKITYVGGFSEANMPNSFRQAQIEYVTYLFENRGQRLGVLSYKIGSYSVTYKDDNSRLGRPTSAFEIPGSIRALLDVYRLPRIQSTEDN